jgi:hypothetical protein
MTTTENQAMAQVPSTHSARGVDDQSASCTLFGSEASAESTVDPKFVAPKPDFDGVGLS